MSTVLLFKIALYVLCTGIVIYTMTKIGPWYAALIAIALALCALASIL